MFVIYCKAITTLGSALVFASFRCRIHLPIHHSRLYTGFLVTRTLSTPDLVEYRTVGVRFIAKYINTRRKCTTGIASKDQIADGIDIALVFENGVREHRRKQCDSVIVGDD